MVEDKEAPKYALHQLVWCFTNVFNCSLLKNNVSINKFFFNLVCSKDFSPQEKAKAFTTDWAIAVLL